MSDLSCRHSCLCGCCSTAHRLSRTHRLGWRHALFWRRVLLRGSRARRIFLRRVGSTSALRLGCRSATFARPASAALRRRTLKSSIDGVFEVALAHAPACLTIFWCSYRRMSIRIVLAFTVELIPCTSSVRATAPLALFIFGFITASGTEPRIGILCAKSSRCLVTSSNKLRLCSVLGRSLRTNAFVSTVVSSSSTSCSTVTVIKTAAERRWRFARSVRCYTISAIRTSSFHSS